MIRPNTFVRISALGALGMVLFLPAPAAVAAERLNQRAAVTELAKSVKAVVEKEGQQAVRVGVFSPVGLDDSNAGAGISALMAEILGPFVNPKARLEIQGVYGLVNNPEAPGVKVVKINAKVFDAETLEDKKVFLPLEALVGANPDIARILNITGGLNPEGGYQERNKDIQDLNKNKDVFIHGEGETLISSSKESPFAVELLVKPLKDHEKQTALPQKAVQEQGKAFVTIKQGELYEVRILNGSVQEIGITLTIDGLDVFTFSEDRKDGKKDGPPRFTHWIVPPAQDGKPGELLLPGWHKTADPKRKDNVFSFLVTEYGQGAVSKFPTRSQGKVGVITVSFAWSYPKGTARSVGETGFGPARELKQKAVERVFDPPHDFVSVRYQR